VAMYAAPMAFARVLLPATLSVDGLALDPGFAGSWPRALTMALLVAMAVQFAITLALGRQPAWLRRIGVALNLAVGTLLVAHGAMMTPQHGVFVSAQANTVAAPIFLTVGGMMVLVALYYAWREWTGIDPAPMRGEMPAA